MSQSIVRSSLASSGVPPGKPTTRLRLRHVLEERRDVEARPVLDGAVHVGDGDDLRACSRKNIFAEIDPTLPKPCTATRAPLSGTPWALAGLAARDHDAAAGGLDAAARAADRDRLAGDDRS